MKITLTLCLLCAVLNIRTVDSSQELIKDLVIGFTKTLNECVDELGYPDSVKQDFYDFWKPDHEVTDTRFGCTVICISTKLDLLDPYGQLHHDNAHDFVTKHGASDDQAKHLLGLLHACDKEIPESSSQCTRTMLVAKCFKKEIHDLDWAPSVEVILAEILADT
ncbi:Pheromone-binding protein [Eumeta japonica]|uniref:Pheromone-binding protein n=1 Tax=Eumeta variegata TaxID=151549 RepID=A0A4C1UJ61_EUMVA|nr:Pheromone-binding protein [Eumeta japonica]